MSKGINTVIGDFTFQLHSEKPPINWTMEDDAWRSNEKIDEHVHRLVSWMGRTAYVIEIAGKTTVLPLQQALSVSRVIAADEAARQ